MADRDGRVRLAERFQGDTGGDGIGAICCCGGGGEGDGDGAMLGKEPDRVGKEAEDRSGRPPNRPLSRDREAFDEGMLIGWVEKVTAEGGELDADAGGVG